MCKGTLFPNRLSGKIDWLFVVHKTYLKIDTMLRNYDAINHNHMASYIQPPVRIPHLYLAWTFRKP